MGVLESVCRAWPWGRCAGFRLTWPSALDDPLYVPMGESLTAIILDEGYAPTITLDMLHASPSGLRPPEVLRGTWERGVPFLEYV